MVEIEKTDKIERSTPNRLQHETSPYLLQHANNPVQWYPWGAEALDAAQQADKPILLSIGYSACHWCHVMERECFENAAIAAQMNRDFICIKVDREERPDLDSIYMAATLAMNNGRGGWPMTVFMTPRQEPFFAGTYFPPEDRQGMPGFPRLLARLTELWRDDRAMLLEQAAQLTESLREMPPREAAEGELDAAVLTKLVRHFDDAFDPEFGGFGPAPKFPPATTLSLLLAHAHGLEAGPQRDAVLAMVRVTLDGMARGGMYDHVGGAFARYSTDAQWGVPHFEKMLYDNALLAKVYCEAFQAFGNEDDARVARETLDATVRDMQAPDGGYYSSTDADSEGVEGKFYVWRPEELEAALGRDLARRVGAYYDITAAGNWEGASIPRTPRSWAAVAAQLDVDEATLRVDVAEARAILFKVRQKRVPPALDDKVLTAWNGLMVGAMATGARVLGAARFLRSAERAADFILSRLRQHDGRLLRTYRAGKAHLGAYLEDYAYLCEGLIDLYEGGGAARYLHAASALAKVMVADFWDETAGAFFDTAHHHEALLIRPREGQDGATPNAHATATLVLARLALHFDDPEARGRAAIAVHAYGTTVSRAPWAFCKTLQAWQMLTAAPVQWVLVGEAGSPEYEALWRAMNARYVPNRVIAHGLRGDAPLLTGKPQVQGRSALYVCRNFTCGAPIVDPEALAKAL